MCELFGFSGHVLLYPRAEQLLSSAQEFSGALRRGISTGTMIQRLADRNES